MNHKIAMGVLVVFVVITATGIVYWKCTLTEEGQIEQEPPEKRIYNSDLYFFEERYVSDGSAGWERVTYLFPREHEWGVEGLVIRRKIIRPVKPVVIEQGTKKIKGKLWVVKRSDFSLSSEPEIPGWPDDYLIMAGNTLFYDFATQTIKNPTPEEVKQAGGQLLKTIGSVFKDGSCLRILLAVFPTTNFSYQPNSPSGKYKIQFESVFFGGMVQSTLKPKVEYPPETTDVFPLTWLNLGGDSLLLLDTGATSGGFMGAIGPQRHTLYIGRIVDGQFQTITKAGFLTSSWAVSPDREKVACAFNDKVLVWDREWHEIPRIPMNDPDGRCWQSEKALIAFNPESDLVCFTWTSFTNTFGRVPTVEFWVGSWRTGNSIPIISEYSRKIGDCFPFFWIE